jgi:hypothetical protein
LKLVGAFGSAVTVGVGAFGSTVTVGVGAFGSTVTVGVGAFGSTVTVGVGVGFAAGFAAATVTPLFQTSFFPLLIQVYFFPAEVEVAPSLEHVVPALTAALAVEVISDSVARSTRSFVLVLKMFSRFE